jgi:hypothetical protein
LYITQTLISCKARMTIATDSIGGHMREADEIRPLRHPAFG